MAGFNVPPKGGPVPMMTPNLLAQLAAGAFKPPGPMAMPSMSAPPMGGGGGDGGLGAGLVPDWRALAPSPACSAR